MPIKMALRHLAILGALDIKDRDQTDNLLGVKNQASLLKSDPTNINKLGILLSKVPLSPKYAKMLVVASKYNVIRYTIMMVACMSVNEIFQEPNAKVDEEKKEGNEDLDAQDPDLVTSIDINRQDHDMKKRRRIEKQMNHDRLKEIKAIRVKWESDKSDCISYAKLMVDYFAYVNKNSQGQESDSKDDYFSKLESRMQTFCEQNHLQLKSIKEVHYLCI